jgi:hypothetical protein
VFQIDLDPFGALAAFKEKRARLRKPPLDAEDFARALERSGLATTAQRLREALTLICRARRVLLLHPK